MGAQLPYMLSPGLIPKILAKIQEARRPERFTQDFLETKLGYSGGSARPVIPLLKRLGFLNNDGSPTSRYDLFRNQDTAGSAMASAMKEGFKEVFDRNEYAGDMPKEKLQSLITEITGLEKNNRVVQSTVSTFLALKEYADFEASEKLPDSPAIEIKDPGPSEGRKPPPVDPTEIAQAVGLNLSYTINLNLPETTNPDVFNAIFRALKENILKG